MLIKKVNRRYLTKGDNIIIDISKDTISLVRKNNFNPIIDYYWMFYPRKVLKKVLLIKEYKGKGIILFELTDQYYVAKLIDYNILEKRILYDIDGKDGMEEFLNKLKNNEVI